ncbi:MAG: hypothetical protein Q4G68_04825 [Planctomycetia bacterium]|nr:hypothetical protein [Planctomycetia bacterium]
MRHEKEQPGITDSSRTVFTSDTVGTESSIAGHGGDPSRVSTKEFPRVVARMPQMSVASSWTKSSQRLPAMLIAWVVGKSYRWVSMIILLLVAGSLLLGYIATTVSSGLAGKTGALSEVAFPDESTASKGVAFTQPQATDIDPMTSAFGSPVISQEQEENVLSMGQPESEQPAFHAVGYQEESTRVNARNTFPAVNDDVMPVIAAEEIGTPVETTASPAPVAPAVPSVSAYGTTQNQQSDLPTWQDLAREQATRQSTTPNEWPHQGPAVQAVSTGSHAANNGDLVTRSYPTGAPTATTTHPYNASAYNGNVYNEAGASPVYAASAAPTQVALKTTVPQQGYQGQVAPPAGQMPEFRNIVGQPVSGSGPYTTDAMPSNPVPQGVANPYPIQGVPGQAPAANGTVPPQTWSGYATPNREVREVNYETGASPVNAAPAYTERSNFRGYQLDSSLDATRTSRPTSYSSSEQGYNQSRNRW